MGTGQVRKIRVEYLRKTKATLVEKGTAIFPLAWEEGILMTSSSFSSVSEKPFLLSFHPWAKD